MGTIAKKVSTIQGGCEVKILSLSVLFCMASLICFSPAFAAREDELFDQGVSLLKQGNAQDAVAVFSQLIEIMPESPDAYRNRGVGYMTINRYDEAILDFQKAIDLKPDLKNLYSNMGVALYYKKEYRKSITFYDKELGLRPDNASAYFNRAICWAALDEFDRGLSDVEKSLELHPDQYLALCLKGDLLVKTGQHSKAAAAYEKAVMLDSDRSYAKQRLVDLHHEPKAVAKTSQHTPKHAAVPVEKAEKAPVQMPFELQVGAYVVKANALGMLSQLEKKGYSARILERTGKSGRQWYVVRVGSYQSRADAVTDISKLKAELGSEPVLRFSGKF